MVAGFTKSIGTLRSHVCRSLRRVGGFLWLLSSTLAFGQNSLMLCPAALEPRADSESFQFSQPSPDQVRSLLSTPSFQVLPVPRAPDLQAETTVLRTSPSFTGTQLSN